MDTDNFYLELKTVLHEIIKDIEFDTSDYKNDHARYNETNKKIIINTKMN